MVGRPVTSTLRSIICIVLRCGRVQDCDDRDLEKQAPFTRQLEEGFEVLLPPARAVLAEVLGGQLFPGGLTKVAVQDVHEVRQDQAFLLEKAV